MLVIHIDASLRQSAARLGHEIIGIKKGILAWLADWRKGRRDFQEEMQKAHENRGLSEQRWISLDMSLAEGEVFEYKLFYQHNRIFIQILKLSCTFSCTKSVQPLTLITPLDHPLYPIIGV